MTNDPLVRLLSYFCSKSNIKITETSILKQVLAHPDYPSLLTISDCLSAFSISNSAFKFQEKPLGKLPTPFIAYIYGEFVAVTSSKDNKVSYFNIKGKELEDNFDNFLQNWSGVALIAEGGKYVEPGYLLKSFIQKLERYSLHIISLFCTLLAAVKIALLPQEFIWMGSGLVTLKLIGLIVSIFLLWLQVDKYNPMLKKICSGAGPKVSCDAVLNSKYSKIFSWLSLSEVGFFYFGGSFLAILFNNELITYTLFLSCIAVVVVPFSLAYQGLVMKKWCLYCLVIQLVLLCEFGLVMANWSNLYNLPFKLNQLGEAFAFFMLTIAAWYLLKNYLLLTHRYQDTYYELKRLKSNADVFNLFASDQRRVVSYPDRMGITLGNKNSAKKLIKVCNPYCTPCSQAHPDVAKLVENNFEVKILYDIPKIQYDTFTPARHLLAIAARGDQNYTLRALDDWYVNGNKDYSSFSKKYPISDSELADQDSMVESMFDWCVENQVGYTPTYYFNGVRLPFAYKLKDLHDIVIA